MAVPWSVGVLFVYFVRLGLATPRFGLLPSSGAAKNARVLRRGSVVLVDAMDSHDIDTQIG